MVIVFLAFTGFFALLWVLGLVLTLRSDGDKTLFVPVLGVALFVGLSAYLGGEFSKATANPHRLTAENLAAIETGASPEAVKQRLGQPVGDDVQIDLVSMSLSVPKEVKSTLGGNRFAERVDAKMTLKIVGEPSRAGVRRGEVLGATAMPADEETPASGLMGAVLTLKAGETETVFTEGEDWNYENDMTPEDVAKALGEAIDAHEAWRADASPDDAPETVVVYPEAEEALGTFCNDNCVAQVTSGATNALRVRGRADGSEAKFYGGQDETFVLIFDEPGVFLDLDFSQERRVFIAGFVKNSLAGVSSTGIPADE